jgi:uncharacterized membrane protein
MNGKARNAYRVAISSYIALIILTLLWEGWLAPAPNAPPGFWLAFKSIPLLIPLFGLLREKPKVFEATAMLILVYFSEGIAVSWATYASDVTDPVLLACGLMEIFLTMVFFWATVVYLKNL